MRSNFYPYLVIFLLFILGYSCKKDDATNPDPVLNISRTDIEVGNEVGYTDTIVIRSNIDWTIKVSDTWLSVDPVKKTGDSTVVTINVTAANTSAEQTAMLTITPAGSDMQPRQVNITRKAYRLVWQKCYGGSDHDECWATVLLPNGQFVSTGTSFSDDGDALGNIFSYTGWVLRVGSDGNKLWQKQSKPVDVLYVSVAASTDGGTVSLGYGGTGTQHTNINADKYDANGDLVWSRSYGGSGDEVPERIISTADGGYLVSGDTESNDGDVKSNHGGRDLWVVKLDANGAIVWEKTFGGAGSDFVATTAACSDGGYIVLGITESNNSGDVGISHGLWDMLVVKIDANGNKIWSKTLGGSGNEKSSAVITDGDGGCILMGVTSSKDGDVAGRSGNDVDTWVVKLNKDGEIGWQTSLGGSGNEFGSGMVRLPNGNIAISSESNSTDRGITGNHGSQDTWVVVVNNKGKILWQNVYGSSGNDYNYAITAGDDGSMWVTNSVDKNDGDVSGHHGSTDVWIFKLR